MRLHSLLLTLALPASAAAFPQSFPEEFKALASDGRHQDWYGNDLAMDGQYALMGAPLDDDLGTASGSIYLYDVVGNFEKLILRAPDGTTGDQFGTSVDIVDSFLVAGAPGTSVNGTLSGSVYFFDFDSNLPDRKITPADGQALDTFGRDVAILGNLVLVGAPGEDSNGTDAGAVYLFSLITGAQLAKYGASDGQAGDNFGFDVVAYGNRFLISAPGDDDNGIDSGSVYVFDGTTGAELAKLLPNDGAAGDQFGTSIALDQTRILVGSRYADAPGLDSGAAYVFDRNTYMQTQKLVPADSAAGDFFGVSVAIEGPLAVVGADRDDDNGIDSGSAYVFSTLSWEEQGKLQPSDGTIADYFGYSVAIDGTGLMAGAYRSGGPNNETGAAYYFDLTSLPNTGTSYCAGDGTGPLACPCNVFGDLGNGCPHSAGGGTNLVADGSAIVSNDTFELIVTNAPAGKPGLLLRGATQPGGGAGFQVGDGLLCTTGLSARSHVQVTDGNGATTFTMFGTTGFAAASYGPGFQANYQFWFRDPAGTCTGTGFNFSNAWTVIWLP